MVSPVVLTALVHIISRASCSIAAPQGQVFVFPCSHVQVRERVQCGFWAVAFHATEVMLLRSTAVAACGLTPAFHPTRAAGGASIACCRCVAYAFSPNAHHAFQSCTHCVHCCGCAAVSRTVTNLCAFVCTACTLQVSGPQRDLHSGNDGGVFSEPMADLVQLLGSLHGPGGQISVPGFYNNVRPQLMELAWQGLQHSQEFSMKSYRWEAGTSRCVLVNSPGHCLSAGGVVSATVPTVLQHVCAAQCAS